MLKRKTTVYHLSSEQGREAGMVDVYWLSRHQPTDEMLLAMYLLHGQRQNRLVNVWHEMPQFSDEQDFATAISSHDGFCYVVAPQNMIRLAAQAGLRFGIIDVFFERDEPKLSKVVHFNDNHQDYGNSREFDEMNISDHRRIVMIRGRLQRYHDRKEALGVSV